MLPGVKLNVQLVNGGIVAQVLPVSVTFPSSAVAVKLELTLRAVVVVEILLIVRIPVEPFAVSCKGDPETLSTAGGSVGVAVTVAVGVTV